MMFRWREAERKQKGQEGAEGSGEWGVGTRKLLSNLHPHSLFPIPHSPLALFASLSVNYLAEAAIARGVIAPRSITAPLLVMV
jgi:hypothetical protein